MYAVALLMSTFTALAGARIYERCELARDLQRLGVDKDQIATWVCIAYHESRFDTAALNPGSGDHGLLQISELYWCGTGKACGAPCSAFRDDDISDDVQCALQIYREHTRLQGDGFLAWVVYPHNCKQNAKKYLVDCDKNIKNAPVKYEDRAHYLKSHEINETEPQTANRPYVNQSKPRYLAINSIFQGSFDNDFEQNYYNNKGSLNWLNYKVVNVDELKFPDRINENQPIRFVEFSTPPTTTTTIDPDLIGIKPPSPRRIETNQFRRKKTFWVPKFLQNKVDNALKTNKITSTSVKEMSDTSDYHKKTIFTTSKDLSQNPFLHFSPSISSSSLFRKELSGHKLISPQAEESSSITILTYDDLAQNPFLNSLPGIRFKSTTETPFHMKKAAQSEATITPKPEYFVSISSDHKSALFDTKVHQLQKPMSSNIDESATTKILSYEDLSENPFLSHILRSKNFKSSTKSPLQETKLPDANKIYLSTTLTPATHQETASYFRKDILSSKQFDVSTKAPYTTSSYRGNFRYLSDVDIKTTEKPINERPKILTDIRSFNKSREASNINQSIDLKIMTKDNMSEISTAIPYLQNHYYYRKGFGVESKTSKPTSSSGGTLRSTTDRNNITNRAQTTSQPQTRSRPQTTTSWPQTTNRLPTTLQSRSSRHFWQELRNITTTTPRPSFTWRKAINSTSNSITTKSTSEIIDSITPKTVIGTRNITTTTPRPIFTWRKGTNSTSNSTTTRSTNRIIFSTTPKTVFTTEATTAKTTQSIFDLYLKPTARPTYKPFEFTTSINNPFKLSIFSDGTTKLPASFYASYNRITKEAVTHN